MKCLLRLFLLNLFLLASTGLSADDSQRLAFFEGRIRPVLMERCYVCHNSGDVAAAGLALDHRQGLVTGGDSGPLLSPSPADSLLLKVIKHEIEGLEMPQDGPKLDAHVVADFERWLADGAYDPRATPPSAEQLKEATSWETLRKQRMLWWSFQPIGRPEVPAAEGLPQAEQEEIEPNEISHIDRFLRAAMQSIELKPNPPADRATLIRRLYFTLLGLPPTPAQIDAFVRDARPQAFERVLDELLESKHFGEHWGRHWLDWLRFAESHGSEGDPAIVGAHHYRDYVIRALNADIPYDQLVREHIAGDLLDEPRVDAALGINESVIGTAHWRMVFHGFSPTDALDEKVRFTDDAIDTFTKAFLGLTVSCARCHDHKFDAISQADYTALFGILASTRPGRTTIELPERLELQRDALDRLKPQIRQAISNDWLASLEGLAERLARIDGLPAEASDAGHVLHPLYLIAQVANSAGNSPEQVSARWQQLASDFETASRRHREFVDGAHDYNWDLSRGEDFSQWYHYGNGLSGAPSAAGEFAIAATGEQVVSGLFPASVVSHRLSDKQGARLTSPRFSVGPQRRLWLQISGGGQAMSRYVVQDFPRDGTVYPVTVLSSDKDRRWHWQAYDVSYWQGDELHLELATAQDAPLLVREPSRSWFGIRHAVLSDAGLPPPENAYLESWEPIFAAAQSRSPASPMELSQLIVESLRKAIENWQAQRLSDAEALLLNDCLLLGMLPNTLPTLTVASPLVQRYRELENQIPIASRIPALDEWRGTDYPLFERGNHKLPAQEVPRRFLEAVDATPYASELSGREKLAEDVLRPDNPFTPRVIVNRLWLHLFGQGLIPTPDNLGRLGTVPTHPELLDYLANEFREQDQWSLKRMIRRIVSSRAWQQSSTPSARASQIDPDNHFYSHFAVQRLAAEAIRDSLLAVSGQLEPSLYGPSVQGDSLRRAIYVRVQRNQLDPFLAAFDAPVPFSCQGKRDVTNVPAQSLLMMNGALTAQAAQALAQRCLSQPAMEFDAQRIDWLWRTALGRAPTAAELQAAGEFVASISEPLANPSTDAKDPLGKSTPAPQALQAWVELAHAVLNLKEFLYVR